MVKLLQILKYRGQQSGAPMRSRGTYWGIPQEQSLYENFGGDEQMLKSIGLAPKSIGGRLTQVRPSRNVGTYKLAQSGADLGHTLP
ncbi:hypothetical protein HNO88_004162 [Novosphingobium chloroacetimidivorans]|uniref:Uncharacterized protein n=1 Tax=Novosphingobium chloroacetimidivorans TaxID=1428314 RepID=A0A7W7KDH4_9SPHN|nr:hypothetical protein [Novosphingobium chloroacetimidivorans]